MPRSFSCNACSNITTQDNSYINEYFTAAFAEALDYFNIAEPCSVSSQSDFGTVVISFQFDIKCLLSIAAFILFNFPKGWSLSCMQL